MPVSASSASLNRFPGLKLLAYALWRTGTIYAQQNMSTVSASATDPVFTFSAAVPTANYTFDAELGGSTFGYLSARSVNGFTLAIRDVNGSPKNLPDMGFIAIYG